MRNLFEKVLVYIADKFHEEPSKMLIWTGALGWSLSSAAQIGAILLNPKISNDQKSFLVPQEMADALANIGAFILITQSVKKLTSKMFSTGKILPNSVKEYLNQHGDIYTKRVGKVSFDIDKVLPKKGDIRDVYDSYKSMGETVATVGAGIVATNIITPLIRNRMASSVQKNYLEAKQEMNAGMQPYKVSAGNMKI